ncbi:LysR family transcriptional regulator [soil metagenome]
MTFSQLRTFVAVAETGGVRAASERLVVTPSAVSSALSAVQVELGTALVCSAGRGLRLTEAGTIYAGYARRILGLLDEAWVAASGEHDPEHGELWLAAVTTAGEQLLPGLLSAFTRRYPGVGLHLEVGNREHVRALLDSHATDLAIAGRPATPDLRTHAVRRNDLVMAIPAGSDIGRDGLGWVAARTWLLREDGSGTRATTLALLEQLELAPRTLTLGSNVAIVGAVAAGLGVTLVSRDAVAHRIADGSLAVLALPGTPLRRDWHLVGPVGRLPATARLFCEFVIGAGQFRPI